MFVRKTTLHTKSEFVARQGKVSGEAELFAKAASHRAAYEWQYSTDGKTWINAPTTLQAKTEIGGLTVGTTYSFRCRPVTKTGEEDWSQVATLNLS